MKATSLKNSINKALLPLLRGAKAYRVLRFPALESAQSACVDAQVQKTITGIELQVSAGGLDRETSLALIAQCTLELMGASGVAIALIEGDAAICRAHAGAAPEVGTRLEQARGISGQCLRSGRIVRCADTARDSRVDAAARQALNLRSAVALPIAVAGKISGVFAVFWATENAFDDGAVTALEQIALLAARVAAGLLAAHPRKAHGHKKISAPASLAKSPSFELSLPAFATARKLVLSRYVQMVVVLAAMAVTFVIGVQPKDSAIAAQPAKSDPPGLRIIPPGEQAIGFTPAAEPQSNATASALTLVPTANAGPERAAQLARDIITAKDVTMRMRTAAPGRAATGPSAVAPPAITFAGRDPALGGLVTPPVPAAKLTAAAETVAAPVSSNKETVAESPKSPKPKGLHRIFGAGKKARPHRDHQKSASEDNPTPPPGN